MGILEDLADKLAADAIDAAEDLGNDDILNEVAKQLGATSTTMEEAYLTSIRIRLSERRARRFLEAKVDKAKEASGKA
ncbi:hypothetical protein CLV78_101659 [Aliiruegeria haliotis]|uniref:Uncharacterized protein n=1 Tax=Aliiruegeria haliotis TaxID=1280846 RepID=A0A2T0RZI1_9RHOB|nr:hypothetical protein [Aliiruegeria haliotis]PRY26560.1 hypothetical protein CLV78_101659 [Aliiruegeria haliotis]